MTDHIGLILKSLREAKGMTLLDVAAETCVSRIYLEAIEQGDFSDLPAQTFSIGFIKSYAKLVNYDAIEAVAQFKAACSADNQSSEAVSQITGITAEAAMAGSAQIASSGLSKHANSVIASLSLVGLVATMMSFGLFSGSDHDDQALKVSQFAAVEKSQPSVPALQPAKASFDKASEAEKPLQLDSADSASTVQEKPQTLPAIFPAAEASEAGKPIITETTRTLVAVEDNWVQLIDDAGNLVWQGVMIKGQSRILTADISRITTGNSGGLSLMVGDKLVGVLGARGEMVQGIAVDQLIN